MCGIVWAPEYRVGGPSHVDQSLSTDELYSGLTEEEEFELLMSLALDDMLEPDEAQRFDKMLADGDKLGDSWNEWQQFDADFRKAPVAEPSANFVASFEERLETKQRRRRIWIGVGISVVALILWTNLTVGLLGAGAYVMFNQAEWLTATVRLAVYISATVEGYATMFTTMCSSVMSSPQAQLMAAVYVTLTGLALWFWTKFLRKSVSSSSAVTTVMS